MKEYRTMWMIPRNIRRIDPWKLVQTAKIVDAATGDLTDQKVQDALYAALNKANVKSAANSNGVKDSGGFRTSRALLEGPCEQAILYHSGRRAPDQGRGARKHCSVSGPENAVSLRLRTWKSGAN